MNYVFQFDQPAADLIRQGLGLLPYDRVALLIQQMEKAMREQQAKPPQEESQ